MPDQIKRINLLDKIKDTGKLLIHLGGPMGDDC